MNTSATRFCCVAFSNMVTLDNGLSRQMKGPVMPPLTVANEKKFVSLVIRKDGSTASIEFGSVEV